jgi:hypothetical protein
VFYYQFFEDDPSRIYFNNAKHRYALANIVELIKQLAVSMENDYVTIDGASSIHLDKEALVLPFTTVPFGSDKHNSFAESLKIQLGRRKFR